MKKVKRNTLEGLAAWAANLDLASIKAGDDGTGGTGAEGDGGGSGGGTTPPDNPPGEGPPSIPPTTN